MSTGLIGNRIELERDLGLELPARAVMGMLHDGVNDALERQQKRWESADLEWQGLVGGGPGQVDLEPVDARDIHDGPHRSIIEAESDRFPAIAIMSNQFQPDAMQMDQIDIISLRMRIEIFVKTGPVTDASRADHETILNRRTSRTTEAVHDVIWSDKTLRGTVRAIFAPPRGGLGGQNWIKHEGGNKFMWQGSVLTYQLQRQASL